MHADNRLRNLAKKIYHRMPLPQRLKWRIREALSPVLYHLVNASSVTELAKATVEMALAGVSDESTTRDLGREAALKEILELLAQHSLMHGPITHWITLPFLATGGAEMVAINQCKGLRALLPTRSTAIFVTDRNFVSERMCIPDETKLIVLDEYLRGDKSYRRKQALMRELILAVRPWCLHNINSEVIWHLILEEGERLKRYTNFFASIFAFQFTPDGQQKIGYAANFLQKGMPHLTGLTSDNRRFVEDAINEYRLDENDRSRMSVLYQPCRLLNESAAENKGEIPPQQQTKPHRPENRTLRPQVLWAGRLDAEKRVDLFLEVVRSCPEVDFRVFGQVVLEAADTLPNLPNLSYEGPFSHPSEWLEKFSFDAFLFTSRWEGMPNILIEVGALRIPVVAPTVGGVGELIDCDTGFPLPEKPTVRDYTEALREIIANKEIAVARAERLLDRVRLQHSWKSFLAALEQVPNYLMPAPLIAFPPEAKMTNGMEFFLSNPLVSVVVPCYNQARYLREAITSVLVSSSHPVEIIVIDDGSTDNSTSRLLDEAKKISPNHVRIHRQENQGLSGARNKGIELAKGSFIQFLDADDFLAPSKIDAQVAQFQNNPLLDVAVCNFMLCDESRSYYTKPEEAIARFDLTVQDFLYKWERGFAIPIHCGLFRAEILKKNRFNTQIRAKEDWLFWTKLALHGARFAYAHGHWAFYRQHEASMRRSVMKMGQHWLRAGLEIDGMLAGREPMFFEAMISWFDQCYRSDPAYIREVIELKEGSRTSEALTAHVSNSSESSSGQESKPTADLILQKIARVEPASAPPFVSVIVPVYGHFSHLKNCLHSIACQEGISFEIICIDDATPDARVTEFLLALKDRSPKLKIQIQTQNAGISVTQNIAVKMARGEFVAFVDCDDALEPDALSKVHAYLKSHPDVDYLFTDRIDVDELGNTLRTARYGGYENLKFTSNDNISSDLLDGMVASHLKVIRRSVYLEVGGSDPSYTGVQDWDLALKCASRYKLHYLPLALYQHRIHARSVTRSDTVGQFRKTNEVRRRHTVKQLTDVGKDAVEKCEIFPLTDLPLRMTEVKDCLRKGTYCIADARGTLNLSGVNFLREFNSYFDQIYWDDPTVAVALYGYTWDPKILAPESAPTPRQLPSSAR